MFTVLQVCSAPNPTPCSALCYRETQRQARHVCFPCGHRLSYIGKKKHKTQSCVCVCVFMVICCSDEWRIWTFSVRCTDKSLVSPVTGLKFSQVFKTYFVWVWSHLCYAYARSQENVCVFSFLWPAMDTSLHYMGGWCVFVCRAMHSQKSARTLTAWRRSSMRRRLSSWRPWPEVTDCWPAPSTNWARHLQYCQVCPFQRCLFTTVSF